MGLDLASVLLQIAVGILAFLWVTTRGRLVSLGYGWLLRGVALVLLGGSLWALVAADGAGTGRAVMLAGTVATAAATLVALVVSVVRRGAGVRGQRELEARRVARVAAMTGATAVADRDAQHFTDGPEFPPVLDVVAPVLGLVALLGAASYVGGPYTQSAYRLIVGALFLGSVTDAMLLGHWYLTQPGLPREPIKELVVCTAVMWPLEMIGLLWPVGMLSVLSGSIDDGYGGVLAWMWLVSAISTIVLVVVTWLALRERYYSAVMAATGLLYLAILTAFGTDLIPRALLA